MEEEMMEDMTERPARRRVVESRREHSGISLGTQFMLVLGITLVVAVIIVLWVSQRTISPTVKHVTDTIGSYAWLWTLLLIITVIGAALGLLRRFGLVKFIEDIVVLGLRVHRHIVESKRLQPDKLGNFPYMIGDDGYPIVVPSGNPAYAQVMPPLPSMGIASRRANAKTTVEAELQGVPQNGMQQLGATPSPLSLSSPQGNTQDVHTAETMKLAETVSWTREGQSRVYTPPKTVPGRYNFIDELAMFQPSPNAIFLGRSANGPLTISVGLHGHIVFAGPTGVGKSKLLRMLFAQFIAVDVDCYLCDSNYIPVNKDEKLDWTHIERRLARPPFRNEYEMADFLRWLAVDELGKRKSLAYHNQPIGPPIIAGVEELASVIAVYPEVAEYLGIILRQGRKYWLFLALAAQDLLVKSIGLDSGMIENIGLGYYGGGDLNTAKIALNLQNGEQKQIDERGLGGGEVYLRTVKHPAVRVRVPWPDDDAIMQLCSQSSLPVHELVREPLAETVEEHRVYQPKQEQGEQLPLNIREFPTVASTKQEDPLDPRILEEARKVKLSDRAFAEHAGITKYQANRYNNRVCELEAEQQKTIHVDG